MSYTQNLTGYPHSSNNMEIIRERYPKPSQERSSNGQTHSLRGRTLLPLHGFCEVCIRIALNETFC